MPLLKLQTSASLSEDKQQKLLTTLSKIVSESIGKPERYVMVTVQTSAMMMSGKYADAAFADIRSIGGLNKEVNRQLSQKLCGLLNETLGIGADRIYLNFTDVSANHWGWNGDTFG